ERTFIVGRQCMRPRGFRTAIYRSGSGRHTSGSKRGEVIGLPVRIPDEGRLSGWKLAQSCVVRRVVDHVIRVERRPDFSGRDVEVIIGLVGPREIGPPEVGRTLRTVDLFPSPRSLFIRGIPQADVSNVKPPRDRADAEPPGISMAHRVDLGARARVVVFEEVTSRNFV